MRETGVGQREMGVEMRAELYKHGERLEKNWKRRRVLREKS